MKTFWKEKMRTCKIYLANKSDINNATEFYINMIQTALEALDIVVEKVYTLSDLKNADYVLTVDAKAAFFVRVRYPLKKIIVWYQGVVPEEAYMVFGSRLRKLYWSIFEYISLKTSCWNIFVSEAMKKHYEKKYKLSLSRGSIIPCFNKSYISHRWNKNKPLSFVYAGSMHKWQCIEETCQIVFELQRLEPQVSFAIYTSDREKGQEFLDKYNIDNATVDYVPLEEIEIRLSEFSYGFIIREDCVVNNVATPTKLNTYYSSGLVPIVSNVINDFNLLFDGWNSILIDNKKSSADIARFILCEHNKLSSNEEKVLD
ncbi:TPA: hypothetical protein ACGTTX_001656, partial [Vibrio parahaemolyticus]